MTPFEDRMDEWVNVVIMNDGYDRRSDFIEEWIKKIITILTIYYGIARANLIFTCAWCGLTFKLCDEIMRPVVTRIAMQYTPALRQIDDAGWVPNLLNNASFAFANRPLKKQKKPRKSHWHKKPRPDPFCMRRVLA